MDDEKIKRLLEIVTEQLQSDKDNLTAALDIVVDFSKENSISPEILLSLVPSFVPNGFYEAAYALSEAAASLSTGHIQTNAYCSAGLALTFMGRTEEAEAQYKLALAVDPNHANSHGAYGILLFINGDTKKALEEVKIASKLFKEKGDKVMEHLAMAWLFERCTEKYYEKGCLRNAKKKKSKGNFKKSGIYARLAGNEYINAAEYAGEKMRELSLTQGYTLLGRSEIRRLELSFLEGIRLRLQHLHSYDIAKFERIMDGVKNASNYYKKAAEHSPERDPQCAHVRSAWLRLAAYWTSCLLSYIKEESQRPYQNLMIKSMIGINNYQMLKWYIKCIRKAKKVNIL